ncbi:hypothetical protein D3C87_1595040 [compost metagenome]
MVNKLFKSHKLERTLKGSSDDLQDSNLNPDYINFSSKKETDKNKKKTDKKEEEKQPQPQNNNQGLIPDNDDF